MKKEELVALGISEDVAAKVLAINGADIEHAKAVKDKEIQNLTGERDGFKTRAETAEGALKSFDGIDPAKLQEEVKKWKDKADAAEKDFAAQITQRDQRDWLKGRFDAYGIASPFARTALQAECMGKDSGLTWKDGAFLGFDDFMKKAKEKDAGLYKTEDEKKADADAEAAKQKAPHFTSPAGNNHSDGGKKPTIPKIF